MKNKKKRINPHIVEQLFEHYSSPEDIFGEAGLFKSLKKAMVERILEGELTTDLGYDKHDIKGNNSGNSRNGHTTKTLQTKDGEIPIEIPRDRSNQYQPKLIPKHQRRFDDLDKKIISLYARGMTTRDIQAELEELYGTEISSSLISNVTNEVLEEVKMWQNRPLEKLYPIVYLDALVIKVKENRKIINKAFYVALGIDLKGNKDVLGIWVSENEGAKFWLNVLTELKNRGLGDILVCCVDGLSGFPQAIETVYPKTQVQLCIVHMVRNSLNYVSWKNKKAVAGDLKAIYTAATVEDAECALTEFSEKWDKTYPSISKSWLAHWAHITPFFAYPEPIRKVMYTTNAIESLNSTLRKVIKNKRIFPSDDSALKQLYLGLNNISKKWTMPIRDWNGALNHFAIEFEERITQHLK